MVNSFPLVLAPPSYVVDSLIEEEVDHEKDLVDVDYDGDFEVVDADVEVNVIAWAHHLLVYYLPYSLEDHLLLSYSLHYYLYLLDQN